MKNFVELNQTQIETFFGNFSKNVEEFLKTQHSSISIPLKTITECIYPNLVFDLKSFVTEIFTAFKNEQDLSERKEEICKADIIEEISQSTFLPIHELCTYENQNEHFSFVENIESDKFDENQIKDLTRFDEIVKNQTLVKESDNCLPYQISTAYGKIIDEAEETFDPMANGMFVDAIQLYYSIKGKLPFKSFTDCFENVSEEK
uniref:Uncharacterized protein n=1 Tax=Panagrolaimus sp. PS1159 TaxID=55785 RepID=A0AC35FNK8_9BILA